MSALHDRLEAAAGDRTYRYLSEITGANAETVRRYMQGKAPSADFLERLCTQLGINGAWLLTGQGPMRADDVTGHALDDAGVSSLLHSLANQLTLLIDRVERIELFIQQMDAKLRVNDTEVAGTIGHGPERSAALQSPGRPAVQIPGAQPVRTDTSPE